MITIDKEFQSLIPPLTAEEYAGLEQSIIAEGCRDALVTWNGTLIDGHNRYEICQKHGIPFRTQEKHFDSREDAKVWIIDNQLSRRNLSEWERYKLTKSKEAILKEKGRHKISEKAIERENMKNMEAALSNVDKAEGENFHNTRKQIAEDLNWSTGKKAQADVVYKAIQKNILPPEIDKKLSKNEMTIHQAYVQVRREKAKENVKEAPQIEGKYRVIYADPPWKYGNNMPDTFVEQADHYPLMTVQEICDMPIKDIAEDNAVLFLWVTSPILEESFQVIRAWGFKYKASFVWDKIKHNMGHYNSVRHEFLLICTRGSCQPDVNKLFDSVVSIERTEHSEKPEYFREIIDTIYPYGRRIELFARKKSKGWDVYGNQIPE